MSTNATSDIMVALHYCNRKWTPYKYAYLTVLSCELSEFRFSKKPRWAFLFLEIRAPFKNENPNLEISD